MRHGGGGIQRIAPAAAPPLVLAVLLGLAVPAPAQEAVIAGGATKSAPIGRGNAPVLDGRLDEPDWQTATLIDDLHQIEPVEYAPPSEPTTIRIYYDDDALYIGARMLDSQPETMTANILRQGATFWQDDYFAVIISPFNDQRNGYRFQINPNGIRMEMVYYDTTGQDWNWNGIWQGGASQDDEGWTAEIAIPFKTLSFNPDNDTWGINFSRDVSRTAEKIGWVSRNSSQDPSIAGEARGFAGLRLGRGLDVVPSVALKGTKDFEASVDEIDTEPSLDVYYKFTPSLNGALTFNTDFSATEVDDRQVELTRFSLFFPEKRTFFLRDSDMFRFARIDGQLGFGVSNSSTLARPDLENGRPYFSRRIGLSATGQPVDLEAGAKLAGRQGRWNLGALAIRQDAFEDVEATDIFVGRIAANVLAESSLGMIVTRGDPRSNLDNSVAGVDFLYNNSRLAGGRRLQGEAWYQVSDTEGIDDEQAAWGLRLRSPNVIGWRGGLGLKEIERNFFPALGFVNRAGIRDHTFELGYSRRTGGQFFRTFYTGVDAQRVDLIDGGLQSQAVTLRLLDFDTETQEQGHVRLYATKEVLTEPFVIWEKGDEQVVIAPGAYSFDEAGFSVSTGDQRTVWGTLGYRTGDFYDGTRDFFNAEIGWRPSNHFQILLSYDVNEVELPAGSFDTELVQLRTDVIFSSTMSWSTLIQYDNISETMGINTRFHWIPEAGREAFIVLNHNLQDVDLDNRFHSALADLAIKVNYTFRF
ncbi:MAG TPA: carbohydrate binding family 9 domain-containing protein [Gammaproteobacteria bacterium]|nr:carbohydrate binding family 9 domain-containing protein [Gammaproteobacteria bacterium]